MRQETQLLFTYSDHGQEVYDTINFMGHSEAANRTRAMLEVPVIIWTSSQFKTSYPDICRRIALSVDNEFTTDNIIHAVLNIMKIETKEYDPAKSFIY
ncbi:MAG: hypothetical protein IJP48_04740 [Synergistaceae bacterium]|nr:hypothetical protein [Synergistaceae bacterium]